MIPSRPPDRKGSIKFKPRAPFRRNTKISRRYLVVRVTDNFFDVFIFILLGNEPDILFDVLMRIKVKNYDDVFVLKRGIETNGQWDQFCQIFCKKMVKNLPFMQIGISGQM